MPLTRADRPIQGRAAPISPGPAPRFRSRIPAIDARGTSWSSAPIGGTASKPRRDRATAGPRASARPQAARRRRLEHVAAPARLAPQPRLRPRQRRRHGRALPDPGRRALRAAARGRRTRAGTRSSCCSGRLRLRQMQAPSPEADDASPIRARRIASRRKDSSVRCCVGRGAARNPTSDARTWTGPATVVAFGATVELERLRRVQETRRTVAAAARGVGRGSRRSRPASAAALSSPCGTSAPWLPRRLRRRRSCPRGRCRGRAT